MVKRLLVATALCAMSAWAQGRGGRVGGFVPGQQRPPEDPAAVERGKALYGIQCTSCHGADLRGGDMGGPNLLRSQLLLADRDGENVKPILQGSRQASGMPAFTFNDTDMKAVIAYLHTMILTIGRQGMPPSIGKAAPSILVGNVSEGQAFFAAKCASCHSATGDLKGIATKYADPKVLQNAWVSGGGGRGRGRGGADASSARTVTATVKLPNETVEGRLVRIDDFLVTLAMPDNSIRTFRRAGDTPKVDVHDPMKAHRDMLMVYTDQNMHDVTAYMVTLK